MNRQMTSRLPRMRLRILPNSDGGEFRIVLHLIVRCWHNEQQSFFSAF